MSAREGGGKGHVIANFCTEENANTMGTVPVPEAVLVGLHHLIESSQDLGRFVLS